jgi:hypothetical protein
MFDSQPKQTYPLLIGKSEVLCAFSSWSLLVAVPRLVPAYVDNIHLPFQAHDPAQSRQSMRSPKFLTFSFSIYIFSSSFQFILTATYTYFLRLKKTDVFDFDQSCMFDRSSYSKFLCK